MTLYQQVREFLRRTGRRPNKKLGQHFLIDAPGLQEIVGTAELTDADFVLEIGAGLGFLTSALAAQAKKVVAIELDEVLYAELQFKFSKNPHVTLLHADILKLDLSLLLDDFPPKNTKIVANLPYYITTPILWKLLEHNKQIDTCVLTVQADVAQRIVAPPGNKRYGALSIGVSYYAQAEIVQDLPPDLFYPAPQVDSSVLKLKMRDAPPVVVTDEALFFRIVRAAFQSRRKMLRNALLINGVPIAVDALDAIFDQLAIDPRRRGETLDITEFAALANGISRRMSESVDQ
ncbi:MAG: 16S rRNA (adenine(1518)-N(6)/adenine(1519)-N(6))-dimethyltransferase RsmA [Candidatus Poribacteria bacterium]|nr:16S rRNA (adenine(1518)-N(6)/adenine(1519)-N(6))-dimethyltransferase RsmA [Candidatus Poribacteria bacterium]